LNRLSLDVNRKAGLISRNIYSLSINHIGRGVYDGIWVGPNSSIPNVRGIRSDVMEALKRLRPGLAGWPAGPFCSEYNWRDGIGSRNERPSRLSTHWAGFNESNHFGTHEFMDFCEQAGCLPYLFLNMGSGSVREMQEWIEYVTVEGGRSPMAELRRRNGRREPWRLPYVMIGNEAWLSGGYMRAEFYADRFRHAQNFVRNLSGDHVAKVACGGRDDDYGWTEKVMQVAGAFMQGLALHQYVYRVRSATKFDEDEWFGVLKCAADKAGIIDGHAKVLDRYDPEKRVALCVDEWGTWHEAEPGTNPDWYFQQDTLRDALAAGIYLNCFNNRSSRVRAANIYAVNVIHSLIRTDEEQMALNPSYHVFDMYKEHQDAVLLPAELECDGYSFGSESMAGLSASASLGQDGTVTISLVNVNPGAPAEIACSIGGMKAGRVSGRVLTHSRMQAHNTFDAPNEVRPAEFRGARTVEEGVRAVLPAKSVVVLEVHS